MNSRRRLSPVSALSIVFVSLFLICGLGLKMTRKVGKRGEKKVYIKTIATSSASSFSLPLSYFCQLMGLSKNQSIALTKKKIENFRHQILESPIIKEVELSLNDQELMLDYRVHYPRAELGDFTNVVLSKEGVVLPKHPFFPSINLAKIYIGTTQKLEYGKPLCDLRLKKAFDLLSSYQEKLNTKGYLIDTIDVSRLLLPSLGKREVVLILKRGKRVCYLRMDVHNVEDALNRFYRVESKLKGDENIVDLRLEDLVFYK